MRNIYTIEDYLSLDPSQLADTTLLCPECGRGHQIPIKKAYSGSGLIFKLPEIIETELEIRPNKIAIVYDRQIEYKLENLFFSPLSSLHLSFIRFPLDNHGILLDSTIQIGDKAAAELPEGIDLIIGVGSGVICDLTKWIATKKDLPFIIMGTAASMNAYTSISATMAKENIKSSINLNPPSAVLLDIDLLVSAPPDMTCAGIGDLLARNVCNADWLFSNLLRGTYFCSVPFDMMTKSQEKYLSKIGLLGQNDQDAMALFSEALLLSGYSMTMLDGITSSSSGSEHVISHFFDFQHKVFGYNKNLHGTQVGVSTIIMSTAYDILREMKSSDFDPQAIVRQRLSLEEMSQCHQREFGEYSIKFDKVIAEKRIPEEQYFDYIENILLSWDTMWEKLSRFLMVSEKLRWLMKESGAVTKLSGLHRSREDAIQALLYGPSYRSCYTVLDLFWELGLFPDLAPEIIARSEV